MHLSLSFLRKSLLCSLVFTLTAVAVSGCGDDDDDINDPPSSNADAGDPGNGPGGDPEENPGDNPEDGPEVEDLSIFPEIATFGQTESPSETFAIYSEAYSTQNVPPPAESITRDISYGPDTRNLLDIHTNFEAGAGLPVLIYVHGGGFVQGDRTLPGPFADNIMNWAVSQNIVGVAMTYKLAPMHQWPSGPDDIATAIDYLIEEIAAFGGDPSKMILMGTSAGGVHVGAYIARFEAGEYEQTPLVGSVLVSGMYDFTQIEPYPALFTYFGDDYDPAAVSSFDGIEASALPILTSISEFDPDRFQSQGRLLGDLENVRFVLLEGHNHYSSELSIGLEGAVLPAEMAEFIAQFR